MPIGIAVVATLAIPVQAYGADPSGPPAAAVDASAPAPVTLTLITGDKVTVTTGPHGALSVDAVRRPPGATGSVRVAIEGGDTYVYPDEAMAYIATDHLDKQLFDVTRLLAQGYDDAHSSALPLIVTRTADEASLTSEQVNGPAARPAASSPDIDLPEARTTLNLPSINGAAVRTDRSGSGAFWSALTGAGRHNARLSSPARTTGTAGTGDGGGTTAPAAAPAFADGVDKVWLDGRARATLADTTAQIGAPAVWAAGGSGAGVRVAVLDTGVDTTHPDLVDRVVASKSFIPGEDIIDHYGHGTHTASTVAGTGAASDGKERGVAPGADLLIGKVLDNTGSGATSGIIEGMEWAAETEHAKVINMSLGTTELHTQDDPLSQAVNRLSAETGALFVIAAGNGGNGPYSVTSPGTADAALTVGAVDTSDHLADFSAAGPRMGDDGLKPDMTAPGVDVLAARSQYTSDGEGYYITESGTSMATPHVAGAAVLLAQKHPDWTGQQIKDALMSSSAPTSDYSPYQAGTGRLDAAAAYFKDQVVAVGSVDAGLVPWVPGKQPKPITRKITYTNTTGKALTLALSADSGTSPAAVFELAADHLAVPAHGSATVDIVVSPGGLAPGQYAAQVTAAYATGVVHTAVGVSVESEKHDLTVHLEDGKGRPTSGVVEITGSDGETHAMWVPDGTLTSAWAPGSYTVVAEADVQGLDGAHSLGYALLTAPEVELTADRTVDLDASRARRVKVATAKPTSVVADRIDVYRSFTSSEPTPQDQQALHQIIWPSAAYDSLWALPTHGKVKQGSFVFTTRIRAQQPPLEISYGGHRLDDAPLVQPGTPQLPDGTEGLDAVFAGTGSRAAYSGLKARGKAVVVRSSEGVTPADQAAAAHAAGAAMLVVVNEGDGRLSDWYGDPDGRTAGQIPVASVSLDEGEALIKEISGARKGTVRMNVEAHPSPKYLYDLVDYHHGGVPADPSAATDPGSLARIDLDFAPPSGEQVMESREDSPAYEYGPAANPHAVYGEVRVAPFPTEMVAPGPRTDYVSAGHGIKWQQYASINGWRTYTDVVSPRPGSEQKDRWFGPVTRPRMTSDEIPYRGETSMSGYIMGFGDGGSAHSGDSGMMTRNFALYQGNHLLTQGGVVPTFGVGDLATRKLPYRLVVDTAGSSELSPYSTTTHTEWRFDSAAPTGDVQAAAIPLIQLDYGIDLDLAGRAKRTAALSVTPTVLGSDSAKDATSSVELQVSYDDGASWQQEALKEKNGTWKGSLHAPRHAAYVSVRLTAEQHNGGGVTQTVIRAFGLR
ncbi:S8 family serine peptidase [Streptomyces fuscigenes]|uniref:S8 family serine peptidase n=1 Tax=Streptomyces fuscigenes TaxID=1528880 RepID=UPI001F48DD85|nr:S8 family serine peptidase [Streptomyces fuscigenes]MCF3961142.1 S8 family serine peptidase [Streptomyces fuscigenes]